MQVEVAVEEAFCTLKGDLGLRPIFHQKPGRIEVHLFIAFLSYCLSITLRQQLRGLAGGLMPRTVFEKLSTVQMLDVRIPTTDGRELLLTCHTQPSEEWGIPAHDDRRLFEFLILEGAQAGLSWLTISLGRLFAMPSCRQLEWSMITSLVASAVRKLKRQPNKTNPEYVVTRVADLRLLTELQLWAGASAFWCSDCVNRSKSGIPARPSQARMPDLQGRRLRRAANRRCARCGQSSRWTLAIAGFILL